MPKDKPQVLTAHEMQSKKVWEERKKKVRDLLGKLPTGDARFDPNITRKKGIWGEERYKYTPEFTKSVGDILSEVSPKHHAELVKGTPAEEIYGSMTKERRPITKYAKGKNINFRYDPEKKNAIYERDSERVRPTSSEKAAGGFHQIERGRPINDTYQKKWQDSYKQNIHELEYNNPYTKKDSYLDVSPDIAKSGKVSGLAAMRENRRNKIENPQLDRKVHHEFRSQYTHDDPPQLDASGRIIRNPETVFKSRPFPDQRLEYDVDVRQNPIAAKINGRKPTVPTRHKFFDSQRGANRNTFNIDKNRPYARQPDLRAVDDFKPQRPSKADLRQIEIDREKIWGKPKAAPEADPLGTAEYQRRRAKASQYSSQVNADPSQFEAHVNMPMLKYNKTNPEDELLTGRGQRMPQDFQAGIPKKVGFRPQLGNNFPPAKKERRINLYPSPHKEAVPRSGDRPPLVIPEHPYMPQQPVASQQKLPLTKANIQQKMISGQLQNLQLENNNLDQNPAGLEGGTPRSPQVRRQQDENFQKIMSGNYQPPQQRPHDDEDWQPPEHIRQVQQQQGAGEFPAMPPQRELKPAAFKAQPPQQEPIRKEKKIKTPFFDDDMPFVPPMGAGDRPQIDRREDVFIPKEIREPISPRKRRVEEREEWGEEDEHPPSRGRRLPPKRPKKQIPNRYVEEPREEIENSRRERDRYRPRDYYEDDNGYELEEDRRGGNRRMMPRGGYPGGNPIGGNFQGGTYTPQGSTGWGADGVDGGNSPLGALAGLAGGIGGIGTAMNPLNAGVQAVGAGWNIVKDMFGINEYRERQKIEAAEKQREKERGERENERKMYLEENQQQRKQRILQEKADTKDMAEKMIKDQERAVRSSQYGEKNAYGDVSWEGDIHKGTRKLVSKLDELQQKKKDRALAMTDEISDKDAIGQMAKGVQESILSQYHRNTDQQYADDVKKAQERLISRGLTESSSAWRKTMKSLSDAREKELANVNDRAVEQGHKYGNEAFKQKMDVYDKMNQFVDPLDLYKSTSGIGTEHLGSVVLPAANYAAGRSDIAAEQMRDQNTHLLEMRKEANREDQAYRERIQNQKMQNQLLQHQDKSKYLDQEHEKGILGGKYYHEAQMKGGDYEHERKSQKGKYYHEARMQDEKYGRENEMLSKKYYHEDVADQKKFDHEYDIAREKLEAEDMSEEEKIYHAERMAKAKIKRDRQAAEQEDFNKAAEQERDYRYKRALDQEDFARKDKHTKQILEQQHHYAKKLKKIDRDYERQAKELELKLENDGNQAKFLLEMNKIRETKKINKDRVKELFEYGGQLVNHGTKIYSTIKNAQFNDQQLANQDKQFYSGLTSKEGMFDRELGSKEKMHGDELEQHESHFHRKLNKDIEMFNAGEANKRSMFDSEMEYNKAVQDTQNAHWDAEQQQKLLDLKITRSELYKGMEKEKENNKNFEDGRFHKIWSFIWNTDRRREKYKTAEDIRKEFEGE